MSPVLRERNMKMPAMKLFAKSSTFLPDPAGGSSARKSGPDPVIKLKRVSASVTKKKVKPTSKVKAAPKAKKKP